MAQSPKISILGVGFDGCECINEIVDREMNCEGVNFAALGFDGGDLLFCKAPLKICIENFDDFSKILRENFSDTDIVFIVSCDASMFIASRVSRVLKIIGIFSVGIFSVPWDVFHGNNFVWSIDRYKKSFDLYFCNLNLGVGEFQSIFECLTDFIYKSGFVNLDFDDIKNFLKDSGHAYINGGYFGGCNKASNAALQASSGIKNAIKILAKITSDADITLEELTDAVQVIKEKTGNPDVEIMWAHILDEKLNNSARVSLIAVFKKD